ncbi:MAG TPA: carboxypeptidase regulatory-like domain-containing protein, partial [Blastocatellia bacterium]
MKQAFPRAAASILSLLFLLLLLAGNPAQGQSPPAQSVLSGRITDGSGAAVSGARVSVTTNKQAAGSATTGDDGKFTIPLAPGEYQLRVMAKGFGSHTRPITLSAPTDLTITLEPASLAETVTVTPARAEIRLSDAPASVSVLDANDVSHAAAQTVDDLLRQVPG